MRKTFGQLKHFERQTEPRNDPTLLIVAPMSGHYATLLRGTVEAMLPEHDVWVTDWRDARNVPLSEGVFDLDDFTDYVTEFCRHIARETGERAAVRTEWTFRSSTGSPMRSSPGPSGQVLAMWSRRSSRKGA